ncbi:hypothetical protein SAMN05518847_105155 [Paenibacillus sp. OV219]|nr:hypothetical protein SAMN05518847_105155 [Paenibacillus sp. OV219]
MDFGVDIQESRFEGLNQYLCDIKKRISASAASVLIIQNDVIINECPHRL